ncbi:efflux RND transporter permease subunit [Falsiroseomonas selenitidurans]|uniref:Multidrug efflux protein n=1 Tax=Falsiroseomonas selenitidurans TaxID=2716335 RepID=A0ABX1E482_9PROT|nr:efflux RND transporter permease subunit [Falsiroseomonas selenitidurans]NKC29740.1 multidrug efflux protein [Falsiroseomonas selenitidurans]
MGDFTALFVRRPVLAAVISLVIMLLGLRAVQSLNVREYPRTTAATIVIATPFPGAGAELVKGYVTQPLEQAIASANGIDFLQSTSAQGASSIQARLQLNYDPNDAVAEILTKINQVRNLLPEGSEDPVVNIRTGAGSAAMYIAFTSEVLQRNQITDYLSRAVRPRLESVPGIQQAEILGAQAIALRVWLDPDRMAARGVTAAEVRQALDRSNVLAPLGETRSETVSVTLAADTALEDVQGFRRLVVREAQGTVVRLEDVARVELGAESYDTSVIFDGRPAVFIGVEVVPTANTLEAVGALRDLLPEIRRQMPRGLQMEVVQDSTVFIRGAIEEVLWNLAEALLIVTVVIWLFLGSVRAALIPAVGMPLSLIGAFFLMLMMGFSINLLTLLALILAIGTVVDDGIIIVENASRHIEDGMPPEEAATRGIRELASSVVAMNVVVIAVYAPVAFMPGLTGSLFTEFAYTVAACTLISGIGALTLSPMMCALLLRKSGQRKGPAAWAERGFHWVSARYDGALRRALDGRWLVLGLGLAILAATPLLYQAAERELAPTEDRGFLLASATADPNTSLAGLERWTRPLVDGLAAMPATDHAFAVNGSGGGGGAGAGNSAFIGISLLPQAEREETQAAVLPQVQGRVAAVPGLQAAVFVPPALPGTGGGPPVQLVLATIEEPEALYEVSQAVLRQAQESGLFAFVETDLKFDRLQARLRIDRDRAADLGIDVQRLALELSTMLSNGFVNRFALQGRSYRVVPQAAAEFRTAPEQLLRYQIRAGDGTLVPLAAVVTLERNVQPRQLARFEQLNAATIQGVPRPGVPLGEAVEFLREAAARQAPSGYVTDWIGVSRQFTREGTALLTAFALSVAIIYLVLAAQYESFRDPLIMLVSVPMAIGGVLPFFALGVVTVNIYTQVGLLALAGSIVRHGILLVEFSNDLQVEEGLDRRAALQKAASLRLRPILMTTLATLVGMLPLLVATGPGAESRFAIGFVLGAGIAVGTLFTLFVVPALYVVLARQRGRQAETQERPAAAE